TPVSHGRKSRVFLSDHFPGKVSGDISVASRFADGRFEPGWRRDHISYVQVDVPEAIRIEGRGQFYEQTGAFRHMVVTHLFQVLGFIAMEPPLPVGEAATDEKAKVFEALKPLDPGAVVRGQYRGYQAEPTVAPD